MKQLIFWDFPRASWKYDVVVALILAFIFLTPRSVFKDQPRALSVVRVPVHEAGGAFWIENDLITASGEKERLVQAEAILSQKTGKQTRVKRLQAIHTTEDETQGYMAFVEGQ